jgi:hypothetical protein
MRERGSALDGFTALYDGTGNSSAVVEQRITTKCTLEYEMVRKVQMAGDRPHKGTPLGRISQLFPTEMLRRALLEHANEFVRQIRMQGYEPLTSVYEFQVFGPYTEKVGEPKDFSPEADNPFIPKHEQRTASKVWGYREDEFDVNKGVSFLIRGQFTRHARHGKVEEGTGLLLV